MTSLIDQLSSVHDPNLGIALFDPFLAIGFRVLYLSSETFRIVFLTVSRYGDAMVAIEIIRKMRDLHILVPPLSSLISCFFALPFHL